MEQRPTLPQVAALAGVSLSSASRALNGKGASQALTAAVAKAAEELGYQADVTGRALRTRRSNEVAVMVADIGNPVYVQLMQGVHSVVAPAGYQVVVASTGDSAASIAAEVRSLSSGFVDGIVLAPLWVDDDLLAVLASTRVPVVVVGSVGGSVNLDSIWVDSAAGVGLAVDHLVERGRRRLGFLNGPVKSLAGQRRQRGFDDAMARLGLTPVGTHMAADFSMKAGAEACRQLLDAVGDPPDAFVAANDMLAIGCIQALRERGLEVPGDVAVTGMDNTEIGSVIAPSLTSVDLHAGERGYQAAQMLLTRLNSGDSPAEHRVVLPELVVRESTGGTR